MFLRVYFQWRIDWAARADRNQEGRQNMGDKGDFLGAAKLQSTPGADNPRYATMYYITQFF